MDTLFYGKVTDVALVKQGDHRGALLRMAQAGRGERGRGAAGLQGALGRRCGSELHGLLCCCCNRTETCVQPILILTSLLESILLLHEAFPQSAEKMPSDAHQISAARSAQAGLFSFALFWGWQLRKNLPGEVFFNH